MTRSADPLAAYRSRLLGLAYRMLGSRADAEDVLQDAYLRMRGAAHVANEEAYLVTTVTRLCLDRLKSARAQRELYVGNWLPEPVMDADALSPHTAAELADDLSYALMIALDRLSPAERAAFLLHDIFDLDYADVADTLGRNEAACRQLASRARRAVRAAPLRKPSSDDHYVRLLKAFGEAIMSRDVDRLTAVLREDAVLVSDGGGLRLTALRPIRGADKIARLFDSAVQKFGMPASDARYEVKPVNGTPSLLVHVAGVLDQIISIDVDGDRIAAFYIQLNPEKLRVVANAHVPASARSALH